MKNTLRFPPDDVRFKKFNFTYSLDIYFISFKINTDCFHTENRQQNNYELILLFRVEKKAKEVQTSLKWKPSSALLHFTTDDLGTKIHRKPLSFWFTGYWTCKQLKFTASTNQDMVPKSTRERETKPGRKFHGHCNRGLPAPAATGWIKARYSLLCSFFSESKFVHELLWLRQLLALPNAQYIC